MQVYNPDSLILWVNNLHKIQHGKKLWKYSKSQNMISISSYLKEQLLYYYQGKKWTLVFSHSPLSGIELGFFLLLSQLISTKSLWCSYCFSILLKRKQDSEKLSDCPRVSWLKSGRSRIPTLSYSRLRALCLAIWPIIQIIYVGICTCLCDKISWDINLCYVPDFVGDWKEKGIFPTLNQNSGEVSSQERRYS